MDVIRIDKILRLLIFMVGSYIVYNNKWLLTGFDIPKKIS